MPAPEPHHDRVFEEWRDQLSRIRHDLMRGFLDQGIWREVRDEIARRRPESDATFLASYTRVYVSGQMSLVRRHTDKDNRTDSLRKLITRIVGRPRIATRTRFMAQCEAKTDDPWILERCAADWDRRLGDPKKPERVNPAYLQADIDRLDVELDHIVKWTNKTIAHLDTEPPERIPTYNELAKALDLLTDVLRRYELLFEQSTTADWNVIIQGDWQAPFRPSLFPLDLSAWWPPLDGFT